ncbi:Putative peptidase S8 propeptide/proteinase inhibitor I9 superfamily [Septoria linicola]|uniref:Peptidase S8 propeptide/proteinase inhibitor I9 superfamily n=1 Tax=Septoria linicola TaxID=215465 RepID=A0A9Q9B335_9PEZI|nr:Putative peptidase S8 propeptide/proteinase inhibitor I9 superfamily [Septoria linicola]
MQSFLNLLLALPAVLAVATVDKRQSAETVPGSWIARLDNGGALSTVLTALQATGIQAKHRYSIGSFQGFAFDADESLVDLVANIAQIATIEPDTRVAASAPVEKRALTQQSPAEYGLVRLSRRARGGSSYIYDSTAGAGSTVYVIDTGIRADHVEFGGRAVAGANFVLLEPNTDLNGHGTHCAGTAVGSTYGVSKRANVIGVKVLGALGTGLNSGVLAGIDWAVNNARQNNRIGRSVISMSLGGGFSQQTNDAVAAAVAAGVFTVVAAGNDGADARQTSPASEPTVFTIGAIDQNDMRASFSNFGPVVDMFAAGVDVKSAWFRTRTDTNTISGTSMACPHVAGLAAYIIGLEGQRTPAALGDRLKTLATKNVVTDAGAGSPNNLAYNGNGT